jgi:hypothetical protein
MTVKRIDFEGKKDFKKYLRIMLLKFELINLKNYNRDILNRYNNILLSQLVHNRLMCINVHQLSIMYECVHSGQGLSCRSPLLKAFSRLLAHSALSYVVEGR